MLTGKILWNKINSLLKLSMHYCTFSLSELLYQTDQWGSVEWAHDIGNSSFAFVDKL